jgi:hypothetical protein
MLMMRDDRYADAFSRIAGGSKVGVCTLQGGVKAAAGSKDMIRMPCRLAHWRGRGHRAGRRYRRSGLAIVRGDEAIRNQAQG